MGILVFDVGTSSMRGVLINDKADILCQFHRKYHPTFYSSIKVTQDPEIWRKALYDIARDVGDWCKDQNEEVEMISLTAQRTSIIPVDHKGDPLCDAVMWQDKRPSVDILRMTENLQCKVVVPIHWDVWTNFQADCDEIKVLYDFKKDRNEYKFHPFFWQVGGKYTYPADKDKIYYHHRRGFEDCFEAPQNIPFRSCL